MGLISWVIAALCFIGKIRLGCIAMINIYFIICFAVPVLGLGTALLNETTYDAIKYALEVGYRYVKVDVLLS